MSARETMSCPICEGSKTIRLPVRHRMLAYTEEAVPTPIVDDHSRVYPCPECTAVQDHKLHIASSTASASSQVLDSNPEARHAARRTAARGLADYMLRYDLVRFRELPDPRGGPGMVEILAQLAVVAPSRITTLERRVNDATKPAIERVVALAVDKIAIWGADYGSNTLRKDEAVRFIREAAREAFDGPR